MSRPAAPPARTLVLALLAALLASAAAARDTCNGGTTDVVVVGAGLAGLSAARALADAGKSVVVLESRNRLGGRLNSIKTGWKTPSGDDIVVDMGASWIHGVQGNPMTELAQQAGVPLYPTPLIATMQLIYGPDHEATPAQEHGVVDGKELLDGGVEAAGERLAAGGRDESIEAVANDALEKVPANDVPLQLGVEYGVAFDENDAAGDAWQISAGTYELSNEFESDEWAILPSGFVGVIQPLAEGLDIRLGDAVKSVQYGKDGVRAKSRKGKTYCAQRAVLAVPLGVAKKDIAFDPPLPGRQAQAIQDIQQGYFSKLFMLFDEPFWDVNATWVSRAPTHVPGLEEGLRRAGYLISENGSASLGDQPLGDNWVDEGSRNWIQFVNLYGAYDGTPVLLAINNGRYARALDSWTQEEVVAQALVALRYMFGDDTPPPRDVRLSNWTYQPNTWGAYPFWQVGMPESQANFTRSTVDRLFWAGDWTSGPVNMGYTHGAVINGRNAASLLLESL